MVHLNVGLAKQAKASAVRSILKSEHFCTTALYLLICFRLSHTNCPNYYLYYYYYYYYKSNSQNIFQENG